ncbi:unnamed protein product [Meloidogyne enterolobii]|uniref:Uncharacterized protein n=1 Tax=Meloidogyne enterolobii TaxID=390850 RepID=A0ACB0Y661_MELEN
MVLIYKINLILFFNLLPLIFVFGELTRHFKEFLDKNYGGVGGQLNRMDMGGYLYGSFGGKEGDNDTIINEVVFEGWEGDRDVRQNFRVARQTPNANFSNF